MVRHTHKDGVAGFYSIEIEGQLFKVWGVWDNEYARDVTPHLFEWVTRGSGERATTNEPEASLILVDSVDDREVLTAELVARELADMALLTTDKVHDGYDDDPDESGMT
jgi:hypothetical protein